MILALQFLGRFLIGSIPFAMVAMLGTGIDIRKVGSGNPGFRNVQRVASRWRAGVTLIGDISKGYIALLLLASSQPALVQWGMGMAAIAGHCWSPFLGFHGGKGVATTFGVLLVLEWRITLPCLALYPLLRKIGRHLNWTQEGAISSLTTMFVISTLVLVFRGVEAGIFAYIMLGIVIVRHIPNLREIVSEFRLARS